MLVEIDNVEQLHVTKSERFITQGARGMQLKWRYNGKVVKLNYLGYEDIAEVMVSHLLQFTDITSYVKYYCCNVVEDGIDLGSGCYSYDFINEFTEVTARDLLVRGGMPLSISYDDFRDYLFDVIGYDVKSYVDILLCLDSITRNGDRHFGNIVFLKSSEGYFSAPVFDNGDSCLSDLVSYPINCDFNTAFKSVLAKPFYTDFNRNLVLNNKIRIRYRDFIESVNILDKFSVRAFETIKRGLKEMRSIAWTEF